MIGEKLNKVEKEAISEFGEDMAQLVEDGKVSQEEFDKIFADLREAMTKGITVN